MVWRTRLLLLLERLWPLLAALACLGGLYGIVSFLGLWLVVPHWARLLLLALFWLAALFVLFKALAVGGVTRQAALRRLDEETQPAGLASTYDAAPAQNDALSREIFAAYQARLRLALARLRATRPRLDLSAQDPYALRGLIVLVLVATGFLAGEERGLRLRAGFDGSIAEAAAIAARLDVWITPPHYTRQEAQILLGPNHPASAGPIVVPAGSVLHLSGQDVGKLALDVPPGLQAIEQKANERSLALLADARLVLPGRGGNQVLDLHAVPDLAPRVTILMPLSPAKQDEQSIGFRTEDDYGIVSGHAEVLAGEAYPHALEPAPKQDLTLPAPHGLGEGRLMLSLGDSPWAGAKVQFRLSVSDEAGQSGQSEPLALRLPQKRYKAPLARALIEQRQWLLLQPDTRLADVRLALQALLTAPDSFPVSAGTYLGLWLAQTRLKSAQSDADLRDIGALLLDLAQGVERDYEAVAGVEAAKQALRDAARSGASAQEMQRLMQNLRQALNEAGKQMPPPPEGSKGPSYSIEDLLKMLDEAIRAGDDAKIQALLDLLDSSTLVGGGPGQGNEQPSSDAMQQQLDDLMRGQKSLRDKTFSQGRPKEEADGPGAKGPEDLQQRQGQLRDKLDALKRDLEERGLPGDGVKSAEDAMRRAQEALGKGMAGLKQALDAQGKALEALRKQAQDLAQQGREGDSNDNCNPCDPGTDSDRPDPLGREGRKSGNGAKGDSGDAKASAAIRARRIWEEIQRRMGDGTASGDEKSYLERLLNGY